MALATPIGEDHAEFDDEDELGRFFYGAFPAIDAGGAGDDVHASGQSLFDQMPCDGAGLLVCFTGAEYYDLVGHFLGGSFASFFLISAEFFASGATARYFS